jgi:prepilin-type N-terminal cleavage/methylation domain-containing protein
MNRARASSRRGFSIIEVALVISAISIVLGLCGGLLHVVLRLEKGERAHVDETATMARLEHRLRDDVHAATRAGRKSSVLRLEGPDDRVVAYEAGVRAIVRTREHAGAVERRETYPLPSCVEPRFVTSDLEGNAWVILELPRSAGPDVGPKRLIHDFQIEALVGRDHRRPRSKETKP